MGLRDRFYTPATAKAILSWRILIGVGVAAAMAAAGLNIAVAITIGVALYAVLVLAAMPKGPSTPKIDPFVLGEPWRQLMKSAQSAGRKMRSTVDGAESGPIKDSLRSIADQLDRGLAEAWQVARRGDEIDDAVRRLDPTGLRSKLGTLQQRAGSDPSPELDEAIASTERQLASAERLKDRSEQAANDLRLVQTRLDELVARASEVRVGVVDTESYGRDVEELVIRLEALHQAVEETHTA